MAFFWKKNVKIVIPHFNILKFSLFHFLYLSVCFSANFQQLEMELVSNVPLWPTLPSPGNNSISTKWAFAYEMPHICCKSWTPCMITSTPQLSLFPLSKSEFTSHFSAKLYNLTKFLKKISLPQFCCLLHFYKPWVFLGMWICKKKLIGFSQRYYNLNWLG